MGQETSFLVYLKEQADFNSLSQSLTRKQQGFAILHELQSTAETSQREIIEFLNNQESVTRVNSLFIANVIVVDVSESSDLLQKLTVDFADLIDHIEPNVGFTIDLEKENSSLDVDDPRLIFQDTQNSIEKESSDRVQWNINWVQAPYVWNLTGKGEEMIYANADTGVLWRHETLYNNYKGLLRASQENVEEVANHNYNWYDGVRRALSPGQGPCKIQSSEPCDDNGHGTHTTSTTVGALGYGVAPNSQWIACRNMDRGLGSSETYLNCLQFFLAPTDLDGKFPNPAVRPHAIGNSYGCPSNEGCARNAFHRAVQTLRAAGIFMSVSAGNEGPGCSTIDSPPGYEPAVISVGATSKNSPKITSFSSRGPASPSDNGEGIRKPDLTAPGQNVKAAFPSLGALNKYATLSGTSMASPHVGGAVLLLTQACPCLEWNVDAMQDLLQETADHYTTGARATRVKACGGDADNAVPNNVYGYGGINLRKAVDKCLEMCKSS